MKTCTGDRETKQWWAVHDDRVLQVKGYSCRPNNPDYWWVPQIGQSLSANYHLFEKEGDAIAKAVSELEDRIKLAELRIKQLKARKGQLREGL